MFHFCLTKDDKIPTLLLTKVYFRNKDKNDCIRCKHVGNIKHKVMLQYNTVHIRSKDFYRDHEEFKMCDYCYEIIKKDLLLYSYMFCLITFPKGYYYNDLIEIQYHHDIQCEPYYIKLTNCVNDKLKLLSHIDSKIDD